jgi:glutamate/tyrosine decarboxylase-like PLP-dependent enzyme
MKLQEHVSKLISFYLKSDDMKLKPLPRPEELKSIFDFDVPLKPVGDLRLDDFIEKYLKFSVNTNHKNFANQLWSKTEAQSILGEILSAVTNTSMYTYEVSPVATLIEKSVISYFSSLIWRKPTDGVMTSGGSASNLQALMIARNTKFDFAKKSGMSSHGRIPIVFAAKNAHYSIKRALNILGLGQENLREVNVNASGVMEPHELRSQIQEVDHSIYEPFCVISTAGTTVEGSFDNISELGDVAREFNLWLHVDAAYGGSVLLSDKHKNLVKGIEKADSVSWDFHKMLGLNLACAFLFVKNGALLKSTLSSGNDTYLFHDEESLDLGKKSLQCGRRNDVLKLWITLLDQGLDGFQERVNKLFESSLAFSEMIAADDRFTLLFKPQSINVCFRLNRSSRLEDKVRNTLMERGDYMVNFSNDINGPFFRYAVTRQDLEVQDFREFLDKIFEVACEFN